MKVKYFSTVQNSTLILTANLQFSHHVYLKFVKNWDIGSFLNPGFKFLTKHNNLRFNLRKVIEIGSGLLVVQDNTHQFAYFKVNMR